MAVSARTPSTARRISSVPQVPEDGDLTCGGRVSANFLASAGGGATHDGAEVDEAEGAAATVEAGGTASAVEREVVVDAGVVAGGVEDGVSAGSEEELLEWRESASGARESDWENPHVGSSADDAEAKVVPVILDAWLLVAFAAEPPNAFDTSALPIEASVPKSDPEPDGTVSDLLPMKAISTREASAKNTQEDGREDSQSTSAAS